MVVRDINLYINLDLVTSGKAFFQNFTQHNALWRWDAQSGGSTNAYWQGRQVFPAGSQYGIHIESGTWDVQLSGYLLSA